MTAVGKHALHLGAIAALAGCSTKNDTAAPRVMPIPLQQTDGGTMFGLDVGEFVVDRENQPLTYTVVSGGGSFTGSVYTNTFDTLGTYEVQFDVADPQSNTSDSFRVRVQTANLAVVQVDGLSLRVLDTDTGRLVTATASVRPDTFVAGLTRGQLVYEQQGSSFDLYAFDLAERTTRTIGAGTLDERYGARTSTDDVVFTRGNAADTDLLMWNAWTGMVRAISTTAGQHDRNPLVNAQDLVFYERGSNGQPDIWVYDPSTDASTVVSADANAETLLAVLPDGAVLFNRIGGGGERDLFWYRTGVGLVEVGADLGAGADTRNKIFHAGTSANQVVFSVVESPTSQSLYYWSNGISVPIDTGEDLTFRAIGGDVVAYTIDAGGQDDVYCFDVASDAPDTPVAVSTDGDDESVEAVVTKSGSTYVVYSRDAGPDSLHVFDVGTPGTVNLTDGAGIEFRAVLVGGDLAYRVADGSAVFHFDPATGTSTSATAGLGGTDLDYAGSGSEAGDFVVTETTGAQTDLYLWDHSASALVTVSDIAGDDVFQAMTSAGHVLFTRVITGNANADLFVIEPGAVSGTRLTDADELGLLHDHEIVGGYTADRR